MYKADQAERTAVPQSLISWTGPGEGTPTVIFLRRLLQEQISCDSFEPGNLKRQLPGRNLGGVLPMTRGTDLEHFCQSTRPTPAPRAAGWGRAGVSCPEVHEGPTSGWQVGHGVLIPAIAPSSLLQPLRPPAPFGTVSGDPWAPAPKQPPTPTPGLLGVWPRGPPTTDRPPAHVVLGKKPPKVTRGVRGRTELRASPPAQPRSVYLPPSEFLRCLNPRPAGSGPWTRSRISPRRRGRRGQKRKGACGDGERTASPCDARGLGSRFPAGARQPAIQGRRRTP